MGPRVTTVTEASLDPETHALVASQPCALALGRGRGHRRHPQPLTLWSWYVISNGCGAMYWKSDQMFVCKVEGKDVPELAVPREKVSEPLTPGGVHRGAVSLRKGSLLGS